MCCGCVSGARDKAGLLQRGDEETSVQHTVRTHQPQHRAHHQHKRRSVSPSCRRRRRAQDRQEGETPNIVNLILHCSCHQLCKSHTFKYVTNKNSSTSKFSINICIIL